jgi:hypothetical protein
MAASISVCYLYSTDRTWWHLFCGGPARWNVPRIGPGRLFVLLQAAPASWLTRTTILHRGRERGPRLGADFLRGPQRHLGGLAESGRQSWGREQRLFL